MEIKKLSNGATIVGIPMQGVESLSLMVGINTGSCNEDDSNRGVAHFLEHMMFKGTDKRPSNYDISSCLDKHGARYNATTGHHITNYFVKCASKEQHLALDVIQDIFFNSTLKEDHIEKEKDVICEEILSYQDNPDYQYSMHLKKELYKDHPLALEIGGTLESVKNTSREDLFNFRKRFYVGSNLIVVVAGKYSENYLNNLEDAFAKAPTGEKSNSPKVDPLYRLKALSSYKSDIKQLGYDLHYWGFDTNNKRLAHASNLLTQILGGNMSSRLFQSIRVKNGLAYSVRAGHFAATDHGFFNVSAQTLPSNLEKLHTQVISELENVAVNGITQSELDDVKSWARGTMALSSESTSDQAGLIVSRYFKNGQIYSIDEAYTQNIEPIKLEDIQEAASLMFTSNYNIGLHVPMDFEIPSSIK